VGVVGVRVSWEGRLVTARKEPERDDVIEIRIGAPPGNRFPLDIPVVFYVQASRYPGIGLLRKGHSIGVRGAIESIQEPFIVLTDAEIEFSL
jgi:hypothetical protein